MEIAALILSLLAFLFSVANFIEMYAQKKSTHSIQMVPADQLLNTKDDFLKETLEYERKIAEDLKKDSLKANKKNEFTFEDAEDLLDV